MTAAALRAPRHQRLVIVTSVLAAVAGAIAPTPEIASQFWIALAPIAFFGLAHGGADPLLMRLLVGGHRRTALLWSIAYVALAAAFLALAVWQPLFALVLFLLLSIWHFGRSDAPFQGFRRGSPAIWLAGSIPIVGPMFGHPEQTGQLFAWLLGGDTNTVIEAVATLGPVLLAAWIIGLALVWLRARRTGDHAGFMELLALAAAMVLLAPVLAFAFYFCIVHSTRHFMDLLAASKPASDGGAAWRFLVRQAAPATLLTVALGAAAWWFLGTGRDLPTMTADATRVVFWGLAALTVPHVIVVERWWGPERAAVEDTGSGGSQKHE